MKNSLMIAISTLAIGFGATSAHAADAPAKAPSAQQTKMKQCNLDAKGKHGDERKGFMKQCLSKKAA